MNVRRLGWAGIEVEVDGATLVVDLFEDASPLEPFVGAPHEPLPGPERKGAVAGLVTHLHADHCDPDAWPAPSRPARRCCGPSPPSATCS